MSQVYGGKLLEAVKSFWCVTGMNSKGNIFVKLPTYYTDGVIKKFMASIENLTEIKSAGRNWLLMMFIYQMVQY